MTLNNLIGKLTAGGQFKILNKGTDVEREVTGTYCCDLLSLSLIHIFIGRDNGVSAVPAPEAVPFIQLCRSIQCISFYQVPG